MKCQIRALPVVVVLTTASLCISCAKDNPHLGDKTTEYSANGGTVTRTESRNMNSSGGLTGSESAMFELEAKVVAVDLAARKLTVKLPQGRMETVAVSDEVRNLPQVKIDDTVKIRYTRSLAFDVREPTANELRLSGATATSGVRAALGELPSAGFGSAGMKVVTIDSIDKVNGTVTIRNSEGRLVSIRAKYPQNLNYVQEGQKMVVTSAETLVVAVERE